MREVGDGCVEIILGRVEVAVGEVEGGDAQCWVVGLEMMGEGGQLFWSDGLEVQPRDELFVIALWDTGGWLVDAVSCLSA